MMKPKERERYERFLLNDRQKYIPMKHEDVARLSLEDRQEYETKLNFVKRFEEINAILKLKSCVNFCPQSPIFPIRATRPLEYNYVVH